MYTVESLEFVHCTLHYAEFEQQILGGASTFSKLFALLNQPTNENGQYSIIFSILLRYVLFTLHTFSIFLIKLTDLFCFSQL